MTMLPGADEIVDFARWVEQNMFRCVADWRKRELVRREVRGRFAFMNPIGEHKRALAEEERLLVQAREKARYHTRIAEKRAAKVVLLRDQLERSTALGPSAAYEAQVEKVVDWEVGEWEVQCAERLGVQEWRESRSRACG